LSFVLPKIECEASSQNYCRFVIGPLESGYGITLGNALRRVLLSSLPGAAVTSMRISGVHHEFSTIPHVKEDTTWLILNVKQLRFKFDSDKPETVRIEVRGEGPVTGADVICPPGVEVVNPELVLLTADSDEADLDIEMTVEMGRGYLSAEERDKSKMGLGEIPVDAIFSPVRRVNYTVEQARVGHRGGYDKLLLEIWTDGSITPEKALRESAKLLMQHLMLISGEQPTLPEVVPEEEEMGIPAALYSQGIEMLGLSVRVYNCLRRAGITSVGQLLEKLIEGEDELLRIRNFGDKSLAEVKQRLLESNVVPPHLRPLIFGEEEVGLEVEEKAVEIPQPEEVEEAEKAEEAPPVPEAEEEFVEEEAEEIAEAVAEEGAEEAVEVVVEEAGGEAEELQLDEKFAEALRKAMMGGN